MARRAALDVADEWTIGGVEDGCMLHLSARRVRVADLRCLRGRVARRAPAGPPKAEPGADAGPAERAVLILLQLNSAVQRTN